MDTITVKQFYSIELTEKKRVIASYQLIRRDFTEIAPSFSHCRTIHEINGKQLKVEEI